ncbi:hypothetical protein PoB_005273100 [Plakobranchus ocellatus]|uniref:Uncharacterized protein n=1 Tax=Plakobranchus ocellatus TaxID=259542 RepID=A0AAV4C0E6_9GAST|nr:hypothetical protein PoB_005273100 [Plakobranchus ocellatus]
MKSPIIIPCVLLFFVCCTVAHPTRMHLRDFIDSVLQQIFQKPSSGGVINSVSIGPPVSYWQRQNAKESQLGRARGSMLLDKPDTYTPFRPSSRFASLANARPSLYDRKSSLSSRYGRRRGSRKNSYRSSRKSSGYSKRGRRTDMAIYSFSFGDFIRQAIYNWLRACKLRLRPPVVTRRPQIMSTETTGLPGGTSPTAARPDDQRPATRDMGGTLVTTGSPATEIVTLNVDISTAQPTTHSAGTSAVVTAILGGATTLSSDDPNEDDDDGNTTDSNSESTTDTVPSSTRGIDLQATSPLTAVHATTMLATSPPIATAAATTPLTTTISATTDQATAVTIATSTPTTPSATESSVAATTDAATTKAKVATTNSATLITAVTTSAPATTNIATSTSSLVEATTTATRVLVTETPGTTISDQTDSASSSASAPSPTTTNP